MQPEHMFEQYTWKRLSDVFAVELCVRGWYGLPISANANDLCRDDHDDSDCDDGRELHDISIL